MQWVLNGEVDITAHEGALYIIDTMYTPFVNHLDGKGTLPIGPPQETDENGDTDPRDLAADICAQHAGAPTGDHQFISIWYNSLHVVRPDPPRWDPPSEASHSTELR